MSMRTQVGIIGAGPSGLLLSQILDQNGIDNVVLERRSKEYVLGRIRAGVLESGMVELMRRAGVGERMDREGLLHDGFNMASGDRLHRVDLKGRTGKSVMVYGQTEVTRDLVEAREAARGNLVYEVEDVRIEGLDGDRAYLHYSSGGGAQTLECDFIAGCDGFHGPSQTGDSSGGTEAIRTHLSFRLDGPALRYPARWRMNSSTPGTSADLALCSMRSVEPKPLLRAMPPGRYGGRLAGRPVLGRAARSPACGRRRIPGHGAIHRKKHCATEAASLPSRCATSGSSSPVMPLISCHRPVPRALTWRPRTYTTSPGQ